MILAQLFEGVFTQAMDARIADVEQVRAAALEHQRTEGADIAAVAVIAIWALAGLRMQPRGVDCHQHALRRLFHRRASEVQK